MRSELLNTANSVFTESVNISMQSSISRSPDMYL